MTSKTPEREPKVGRCVVEFSRMTFLLNRGSFQDVGLVWFLGILEAVFGALLGDVSVGYRSRR